MTGGTGDYSPQFYTITTTQTGNDVTNNAVYPVPIPRYSAARGEFATVMEVLRIEFTVDDLVAAAAQASISAAVTTSDPSGLSVIQAVGSGSCIGNWDLDFIFSAAGGFQWRKRNYMYDATDGSGRGVLVATDNIFIKLFSNGTGRANTVVTKILYRLKDVSIQEYIGIVQSQQQAL